MQAAQTNTPLAGTSSRASSSSSTCTTVALHIANPVERNLFSSTSPSKRARGDTDTAQTQVNYGPDISSQGEFNMGDYINPPGSYTPLKAAAATAAAMDADTDIQDPPTGKATEDPRRGGKIQIPAPLKKLVDTYERDWKSANDSLVSTNKSLGNLRAQLAEQKIPKDIDFPTPQLQIGDGEMASALKARLAAKCVEVKLTLLHEKCECLDEYRQYLEGEVSKYSAIKLQQALQTALPREDGDEDYNNHRDNIIHTCVATFKAKIISAKIGAAAAAATPAPPKKEPPAPQQPRSAKASKPNDRRQERGAKNDRAGATSRGPPEHQQRRRTPSSHRGREQDRGSHNAGSRSTSRKRDQPQKGGGRQQQKGRKKKEDNGKRSKSRGRSQSKGRGQSRGRSPGNGKGHA